MTARDPQKQLATARILVAMFEQQLAEYDAMPPAAREATPRGRDLTARLPGLRVGHKKWTGIRADLERQLRPKPQLPKDEQ